MTRRSLVILPLAPFALRALATRIPLHWIALNLTGDIRDFNWPNAAAPVSLGSLLKPFLVLAFLSTHRQSPLIECRGAIGGCWYAQGHGWQDIVSALANSCTVYFLQLAASVDHAALDLTCLSYGLSPAPRAWGPSRLIGLGQGWPQAPIAAARAFAALARDRDETRVRTVLGGMAQCARVGTGRAVHIPCFAKTGTAPCSHPGGGSGDGYIIAIYPMDQPRDIILAMRHNTNGANAATSVKPLANTLAQTAG